jgi:hypothetical protein
LLRPPIGEGNRGGVEHPIPEMLLVKEKDEIRAIANRSCLLGLPLLNFNRRGVVAAGNVGIEARIVNVDGYSGERRCQWL